MSALANYRTAILALLDDPSKTRYSDAQVDQALRLALLEYSRCRPYEDTYMLDTDGNRVLSLPSDFTGIHVSKVEVYNSNPDLIYEIGFYAYKVGAQWHLETTDQTLAAGEILIVTYSMAHSVDDLDSAAGTTVPEEDEALLQIGAAGYAALSRATSRAETINMQPQVSAQVGKVAETFLAQFRTGIAPKSGAFFADPP